MQRQLQPIAMHVENNHWVENSYRNSYSQTKSLAFLLLAIPQSKEGALETLLLDAIAERAYDRPIVEQSRIYVKKMQPMAERYLHKTRLRLKACLGVTWAIQCPEKIFSFIDEQIRSVKWERSEILAQCFQELRQI